MRSFLGVPILGGRGTFGNLYLTEKVGGDAFTEEDQDIAILVLAAGSSKATDVYSTAPSSAAANGTDNENDVGLSVTEREAVAMNG